MIIKIINNTKLILSINLLAASFFISSCFTKQNTKRSCKEFFIHKDINHYSKKELEDLLKAIRSRAYGSSDGCHDALMGKIHSLLKNSTTASQYFLSATKKLPEFKDYFLLAKAQEELKKNHLETAFGIAHALIKSNGFGKFSHFNLLTKKILADIALAQKDDIQIVKTHQDLIDKGYQEDDILLFNLATSLNNIGEYKKANQVFKKLITKFPLSHGAQEAEQLMSLAQYRLSIKEIELRFNELIKKLAFEKVVSESDTLLKKEKSLTNRAKLNAMSVKALMLNNQFQQGLERSQRAVTGKNVTEQDLEIHAWALAKAQRPIKAAHYYGELLNMSDNKEKKAQACFFQGFSYYEASLYSTALLTWRGCKNIISNSSYTENYLWYQALSSMLSNNFTKAKALLKELTKSFNKSSEEEKYRYFLGYSYFYLGKRKKQKSVFKKLAKKKNPSYYMLLARKFLHKKNPSGKNIPADAMINGISDIKDQACQNAITLFYLGFTKEARDLALNSKATNEEKAAILQHIGFYHDVWRRAYKLNTKAEVKKNKLNVSSSIRANYPLPYLQVVKQASKKYNISSSLLYAIMQTESGFSTNAMSSRGALGLMQMMPFVASDLASKLNLEQFHSSHLKDPKVSIPLGALLIANLKRQFGSSYLTAAAYNAGAHKVRGWLDTFGHLPTELFIERIPYKQTREYVKKVLPSDSLYRAMNGYELKLIF